MNDTFSTHASGLESPANEAFAIIPDDANDLASKPRGLYIGVAGHIVARLSGVDVTFQNVSGILPIRPDRVLATGTTAANIIGLL